MPLLQRELLHCARMAKQSPQQYLAQNEHILFDASNSSSPESQDISVDINENGKRRSPDRWVQGRVSCRSVALHKKLKFACCRATIPHIQKIGIFCPQNLVLVFDCLTVTCLYLHLHQIYNYGLDLIGYCRVKNFDDLQFHNTLRVVDQFTTYLWSEK